MVQENYKPIACSLYDGYEIAAMSRKSVELCWLDEQQVLHQGRVTILDIYCRDKAEFILVKMNGQGEFEIRLDRIR